ncbi:MAG TPA: FAD binding domain-containing protein [Hyphomicrobiaceae bacterium]|nr:FAD binding domain-containing protein [Hyphomicrobiaceae bacterium]
MLLCDEYLTVTTLGEALAELQAHRGRCKIVAGATDILPWAREGRAGDVHVPVLIDISRIPELSGYQVSNGRARLGANVVFQRFLTDDLLREHLPCMPYCAVWFADDQIREQATLAGNIVNASPAADGTPPLLAMDAEIEIARLVQGSIEHRSLPLSEFVLGPGKTALEPDEIVTAITCTSMAGYGGSFQKVGRRRSLVISTVCAAALAKIDSSGQVIEDVRVAVGGIGPVPMRLKDVEDKLKGERISQDLIARVSALAADRVASRTRQEYRRSVVCGFVQAAIEEALVACGAAAPGSAQKEAAHA